MNEGSTGYFRVRYPPDLLSRLLNEPAVRLIPAERAGLVSDLNALVRSGDVKIGDALPLIPTLLRDADRTTVIDSAALVMGAGAVPETLKPALSRFIRQTYGERARKLGWQPQPGEEDETRFLRFSLVPLVAAAGEDPPLVAEAKRLAQRCLEDPHSVDPDIVRYVISIAADTGDAALYNQYLTAARQSTDPQVRTLLLATLGRFKSPELALSSLKLLLQDDFPPRESLGILTSMVSIETRALAYEFLKAHFDELLLRLPRDLTPTLLRGIGLAPDATREADAAAFFRPRAEKIPGGPRLLEQTLEQTRLGAELKRIQLPSLEAFLAGQR